MKKFLLIIVGYCTVINSFAQNGELPSINLHEVSQLGTISEYNIAGAEAFAGGRLTCLPNSCLLVLPVTLLSFEGRRVNGEIVELKWQTVNEINNAGFDVERSLGNTGHFEKIAFVAGQGNSASLHNYLLNDPNNYTGRSYYRLKQIDYDGEFHYSKVISVAGYNPEIALHIFPNPAHSRLHFTIDLAKAASGIVAICDLNGKIMIRETMQFEKGHTIKELPLDRLAAGMYFLRITLDDRLMKTEKFIKLK